MFGKQTFFVVQKNLFLFERLEAVNDVDVFVVAVVVIDALVDADVGCAEVFVGVVGAGDEFCVVVVFFMVVAVSSFIICFVVFECDFVVVFFAVSVCVAFVIIIIINIVFDAILRSAEFVLCEDVDEAESVEEGDESDDVCLAWVCASAVEFGEEFVEVEVDGVLVLVVVFGLDVGGVVENFDEHLGFVLDFELFVAAERN